MFYKEMYSNMLFEHFYILFLVFANMSRQRCPPYPVCMFLLLEKYIYILGNCVILKMRGLSSMINSTEAWLTWDYNFVQNFTLLFFSRNKVRSKCQDNKEHVANLMTSLAFLRPFVGYRTCGPNFLVCLAKAFHYLLMTSPISSPKLLNHSILGMQHSQNNFAHLVV